MCYGCYEDYGSPILLNEKTIKAASLIKDIYNKEGCEVGGYAHIVVDDWNVDNACINFCIEDATKGECDISETGRIACLEFLNYFNDLSEDERVSSLAIYYEFLPLPANPHKS